jgi:hypothetical protein
MRQIEELSRREAEVLGLPSLSMIRNGCPKDGLAGLPLAKGDVGRPAGFDVSP